MMNPAVDSADYEQIFQQGLPLLDVRAPVEFAQGAFPGSVNLPLLDDKQRALIGTCYKAAGQTAALDLGWSLLTPELKQQRQQQWLAFIKSHPNGLLYCFRGGLRSQIAQQLIADAGGQIGRIPGGYKAMRRYLLLVLEGLARDKYCVVVAGPACSGKTRLLAELPYALDLEGLAKHRGSAFGNLLASQPSQIDFENALAVAWLQLNPSGPWFVEDEGKLIGRCSLPSTLKATLRNAPRVVLRETLSERIQIAMQDYVRDKLQQFLQHYGDEGLNKFAEALRRDLTAIKKRLGGLRYEGILRKLNAAIAFLQRCDSMEMFPSVIEALLTDYYDPMYEYQHQLNSGPIVMEGDRMAIKDWAMNYARQYGDATEAMT